jgi:hypothetical protein
MTRATVIEQPQVLEPVTDDAFGDESAEAEHQRAMAIRARLEELFGPALPRAIVD